MSVDFFTKFLCGFVIVLKSSIEITYVSTLIFIPIFIASISIAQTELNAFLTDNKSSKYHHRNNIANQPQISPILYIFSVSLYCISVRFKPFKACHQSSIPQTDVYDVGPCNQRHNGLGDCIPTQTQTYIYECACVSVDKYLSMYYT